MVFPGRAEGSDAILDEMKRRLTGFDQRALVTALNSDEHQTYVVWDASSGTQSKSPSPTDDEPNPFLIN